MGIQCKKYEGESILGQCPQSQSNFLFWGPTTRIGNQAEVPCFGEGTVKVDILAKNSTQAAREEELDELRRL